MDKQQLDNTAKAPFSVNAANLSLSRGDTLLFADVSFEIQPQQLIWVNGGNGMGKTSLLRLLAGFTRPDNGNIDWQQNGKTAAARDIIGFQGHLDAFKPSLTAHEALQFWADIMNVPNSAEDCLSRVGLNARKDVRCGQLSAGQKRRLALARLILSRKPVWIMDEPTAAMDAKGVALIHSLVENHIMHGGSAVIASHNPAQTMTAHTRRLTLNTAELTSERRAIR